MPAGKPHILICDDESGPRLALEMTLARDYECTITSSVSEALTALKQQQFDVALLDWQLSEPGTQEASAGTGGTILDYIRTTDPSLSVIIFSAYLDEIAQDMERRGAIGLLQKPPSVADTRRLVKEAVELTRSRRRS